MTGERRPDCAHDQVPDDLKRGDYWRTDDGVWHAACPSPTSDNGFLIANLANHHVEEHEDGTITVAPGGGGHSNSILVERGRSASWHGYIHRGRFQEVL